MLFHFQINAVLLNILYLSKNPQKYHDFHKIKSKSLFNIEHSHDNNKKQNTPLKTGVMMLKIQLCLHKN